MLISLISRKCYRLFLTLGALSLFFGIILFPAIGSSYSSVSISPSSPMSSGRTSHALILHQAKKLVCADEKYQPLCSELNNFWGDNAFPPDKGLYKGSNDEHTNPISQDDRMDFFVSDHLLNSARRELSSYSVERGLNHSYNPFKSDSGSAWPTPSKTGCWNQPFSVMNAKEWALSSNNIYNWNLAKSYYRQPGGDEGKREAYYLLGHVAHILADMAVPAHVHIIKHAPSAGVANFSGCLNGYSDNYEDFISDPLKVSKYVSLANLNNVPGAGLNELPFKSLEDAFERLARFTYPIGYTANYSTYMANYKRYTDFGDPDNKAEDRNEGFGSYLIPYSEANCTGQEPDMNNDPIEQDFLNNIAKALLPKSAEYVAGLFRLFWDETHVDSEETFDGRLRINTTLKKFTLKVISMNGTVTGAGIACGRDCQEVLAQGVIEVLTAVPAKGYKFTGWSGCDSRNGNQCTVTMRNNRTVKAIFTKLKSYTLTVIANPLKGGQVTSDQAKIECGQGKNKCRINFTEGDPNILTLYATPATGYKFSSWRGCNAGTTALNKCSVTVNANKTVTATFNASPGISISGNVTLNNAVLSGTVMTLSGGTAATTVTDGKGNFAFRTAANYDYTLTPFFPGCIFTPSSRNISATLANVTAQIFTATQITLDVPAGVSVTAGDKQVAIGWSAVAGAVSYNVYYQTSPGVNTSNGIKVSGVTPGGVVAGLVNGINYYFVVTAVNAGVESAISAEVNATPQIPIPGTPTGISAIAGNAQVILNWAAVTEAVSYNVYYRTSPGVNTGNGIKVSGATPGGVITGLLNGINYYFVVTALNAGGESGISSQVNAKPRLPVPVPMDLSATGGDAQVHISWTGSIGATSYNVYWSTDPAFTRETAMGSVLGVAGVSTVVTGLTNGIVHYFMVTAVTAQGESSPGIVRFVDGAEKGVNNWTADSPWGITTSSSNSGGSSFTDSPNANYANGVNLSMTLAVPLDFTLADSPSLIFWHKHSTEPPNDVCYVEVSMDGGVSWTSLAAYTGGLATWTQAVIDLSAYTGQPSVKVRFRIQTDWAVRMDGWYLDDIQINGFSNKVSATPILTPGVPTMNAPMPADGRVTLNWSLPVTGGPITSYNIYYIAATNVSPATIGAVKISVNSLVRSYTVNGLTNGTQYAFVVTAVNATAEISSGVVTATPLSAWTTKTPMVNQRDNAANAVLDGIVYVMGGAPAGTGILDSMEAYDPATDTWTLKALMPAWSATPSVPAWAIPGTLAARPAYRYGPAAAAVNGLIYLIGGTSLVNGQGPIYPIAVYSPVTNAWSATVPVTAATTAASTAGLPLAPIPTSRWGFDIAVVDGLLYAVGGSIQAPTGVTRLNGTKIAGTSASPITGLKNGKTYCFAVTAMVGGAESALSTEACAIPEAPGTTVPSGLSAVAGDGQVTLSWSPVAGALSYNVYYSLERLVTVGGAGVMKVTGAVSGSPVTGLVNGTTYYFIVTAMNGAVESAESSEFPSTPYAPAAGAPAGLIASAGDGQVTLSWTALAGATTYNVYYGTGFNVYYGAVEVYDPVLNTWTKKTPMPTPRFGMSVAVVNGLIYAIGGWAGWPELSIVEIYDPTTNSWSTTVPVNAATTAIGTAGALLAPMPTARDDFGFAVVNGVIYAIGGDINAFYAGTLDPFGVVIPGSGIPCCTTVMEAYDTVANTWTTKAPMPTMRDDFDASVVDSVIYGIAGSRDGVFLDPLQLINAGGYSLTTVEAYSSSNIPTPKSVAATVGVNQVSLNWTAVAGAMSYNIYWSNKAGISTTANSTKITGVTAPYVHSGLTPGRWHYYVVTAVTAAGESLPSNEVSAKP